MNKPNNKLLRDSETNKLNKLNVNNVLNSNIYFYKDKGSFGIVVYDDNNIIYKILELGVSENNYVADKIERNNLIEIVMLNSISDSKNLLQSKSTFIYDNSVDKSDGKKIGLFQPLIYQKCPWVINDSSIF